MCFLFRVWIGLASAAAIAIGTARAVVIDDFTAGPIVIAGPATQDQTGLDPAQVLGGTRQFEVGQFGTGSVLEINATGGLHFSSVTFGYFTLAYGGVAPIGGLDLTASGDDRYRFRFGDIGPGFHPFGLYVNLPTYTSKNGRSLYLLDAWDDLILELPFAALPSASTAVDKITIDVFRNPGGTSFDLKNFSTGRRELSGDFNYDGVVDKADLDDWSRLLGVTTFNGSTLAFVASVDADQDGRVAGSDFLTWQRGVQPTADVANIPEPTSLAWAVILVAAGECRRRGRFLRSGALAEL